MGCLKPDVPPPVGRPNILAVVADDLGYSDLGVYGSEIPTPYIDGLAASGMRATDFYVAPRGAPTRAMLLTGVDHHLAAPGGSLSPDVVTVASQLRDAGYHTVMAGKWELGEEPENSPSERGFERSFVLYDAAASHWEDMKSAVPGREQAHYEEDGVRVDALPGDYFSTRSLTDFVIESLAERRGDGRPFFAYLSYQAPHGPLAAPADWRDRFAGKYDAGFDEVRDARLLEMKKSGVVRKDVQPYPGIPTVPHWGTLTDDQKREQSRRMELYAAMVTSLDFQLGRLLDELRSAGELDRTLVVVLSDNGPEPGDRGPAGMDPRDREWYAHQFPETRLESWGMPGSFVEYGAAWAEVSSVPFRLFKGTSAEGGVRSPLVVSGPGVKPDWTSHAVMHVSDLTPTFLELAGVPAADGSLRGRSLVAVLADDRDARHGPHEWLAFEYGGDRALRQGRWKLLWMDPPFGLSKWRLYRIDRDPAELWDRAEDKPNRMVEMTALWKEYADANGVPVPDEADDTAAE